MASTSSSRWKKPLLIGCVLLCLLGIGAFVVVLLNWGSISGFATEATARFKELYAVRDALQEQYHVPQVAVKAKKTTNVDGTILSIEVPSAPFFRELMVDGEEGRLMAMDMACSARAALSNPENYPHFEVIFNKRSGTGLTISRTRGYMFEDEEVRHVPSFMRSGTVVDDDVEEPLREEAKRYERALQTSNTGIEHLRSLDYRSLYAMCGPELHATIGEGEFAEQFGQAAGKFGALERFKPMQWKFALRATGERRFLYSTKIVEHERAVINYNFIFDADGDFTAPVGLQWHTRSVEDGAPK